MPPCPHAAMPHMPHATPVWGSLINLLWLWWHAMTTIKAALRSRRRCVLLSKLCVLHALPVFCSPQSGQTDGHSDGETDRRTFVSSQVQMYRFTAQTTRPANGASETGTGTVNHPNGSNGVASARRRSTRRGGRGDPRRLTRCQCSKCAYNVEESMSGKTTAYWTLVTGHWTLSHWTQPTIKQNLIQPTELCGERDGGFQGFQGSRGSVRGISCILFRGFWTAAANVAALEKRRVECPRIIAKGFPPSCFLFCLLTMFFFCFFCWPTRKEIRRSEGSPPALDLVI